MVSDHFVAYELFRGTSIVGRCSFYAVFKRFAIYKKGSCCNDASVLLHLPQEENAKRRKARRMRLLREKVLCMAKELRRRGKAAETAQCPGTGPESSEVKQHGCSYLVIYCRGQIVSPYLINVVREEQLRG